MDAFLFALILTIIAGLSTTIGSIIAFIIKEPSKRFISLIMGFSAGVMVLISFVELLQAGIETLGFLFGNIFFLIGINTSLKIMKETLKTSYIKLHY